MKHPVLAPATARAAAVPASSPAEGPERSALTAGLGRPGGTLARLLAGMAAAFREGIVATWNLAGSGQVLNLLLLSVVLLGGFVAQRVERIERHLDSVAEAQRITGFAVMKQLQALGLAPHEGKDDKAGAPAGAAQAAPAPIDPTLLEAHPARPGPALPGPAAPLAPAAPAAAPPAVK